MKHLHDYSSYLIFESLSNGSDILKGLENVVNQAVDSSKGALEATEMIKSFTDKNKEEILKNISDPNFIKAMLTILAKWSSKYGKELDASEFDYVTSSGELGDEGELGEYVPSDIDELSDEEDLGDLF